MIIDSLYNCERYLEMNPEFAKAFSFLRSTNLRTMDVGKYEIDGKNVFLTIMDAELKKPENANTEAHDKYIDIQVVIAGKETYGWTPREECLSPRGEIDPEKDLIFFDDAPKMNFSLTDEQFAIFFPWDGHAPMIGEGTIRKCVVKVKMDQ